MNPERKWDDKDRAFKFQIHGISDLEFIKCPFTCQIVSGYESFSGGDSLYVKSVMKHTVALFVTEAKLMDRVQCAQDMLYVKRC